MREIWIPLVFTLTLIPPTGWARTNTLEVVTLPDASLRPVLENSAGLSKGNLWFDARRNPVTNSGSPRGVLDLPILAQGSGAWRMAGVRSQDGSVGVTDTGFHQVLSDAGTPSPGFETRRVTQPDVLAQAAEGEIQTTAQGDSVQLETGEVEKEPVYLGHRVRGLGGSKHSAVRIPTKVVFGTLFCVASTAISASLYDTYLYSEDGTDHLEVNPWGGLDGVLYGLMIGSAVGFPAGVSVIDPDDSLPRTLLAGIIPGAVGLSLLESTEGWQTGLGGFLLVFVFPPFTSLAASELWRNPSEDHRTSFAIVPTPKGGLSAVTTLRL